MKKFKNLVIVGVVFSFLLILSYSGHGLYSAFQYLNSYVNSIVIYVYLSYMAFLGLIFIIYYIINYREIILGKTVYSKKDSKKKQKKKPEKTTEKKENTHDSLSIKVGDRNVSS